LSGIIHRDIKPANILVVDEAGAPLPKVIDFGIAKAMTNQPVTGSNLNTAHKQFIGTPAYMSPEQAGLGGVEIDSRTDVYSLGVLLYELLVGCLPFTPDEFSQDVLLQKIREEKPLCPSARFRGLGEKERLNVAHCRQVEPSGLLEALEGGLDLIVMKCLERDRGQRYETADGLATALQSNLKRVVSAKEPVLLPSAGTLHPNNTNELHEVSAVQPSFKWYQVPLIIAGAVLLLFMLSMVVYECCRGHYGLGVSWLIWAVLLCYVASWIRGRTNLP
jgi:serine/threonine protein kinase